jgi:hypothetical protein
MHWRRELLQEQIRDLSSNLNELGILTSELAETMDREELPTNREYSERPFNRTVPMISNLITEPWRETEKLLESVGQESEKLFESALENNLYEKPVQPQKPPNPGINGLKQPRQFSAGYFKGTLGRAEEDYDVINNFLLDVSPELEAEYGVSPAAARSQYEQSREENCQVELDYQPSSLNS